MTAVLSGLLLALVLLIPTDTVHPPQTGAQGQETASCVTRGPLPDPVCTPGATDPRVTQANVHETICLSGYSPRMRPPVPLTNSWKRDRMRAYGETGSIRDYENDHLVSIELGGDPGAIRNPATGAWTETNWQGNLWPQARSRRDSMDAGTKDVLENALHRLICNGEVSLTDAQEAIATDWVTAYREYVDPRP